MQIHEITTAKRPKKKLIGRGGKRGTYSGRGNKGQKARSGGNVNPLFEGGRSSLVERMKKLRGFKSIHPKKNFVSLAMIEKQYVSGEVVSVETLVAKKLVKESLAKRGIKLLSKGNLTKKLTIASGILISESAQAVIEAAGGKVEKGE